MPKFFTRVSSKGKGAGLRNLKSWFESTYPYHFRPVAQLDRAHPSEGCDLSSNLSGPTKFARWRPTGEALRCLRSLGGFNSRPSRQSFFEVQFDRDRSRSLKAVRRDRYPRTLPWGQTRLEYRGRSFKPLQAGSIPVGPTKFRVRSSVGRALAS